MEKITVKTDEVGRLVIPKNMRKYYDLTEGSYIQIKENQSFIFIEKINMTTTIDSFGRILIPQKIRKRHNISKNERLFLSATPEGIKIESYVKKHQSLINKLKYIEKEYDIETVLFDNDYLYSSNKYKDLKKLNILDLKKYLNNKQQKYIIKAIEHNLKLFIIYENEKEDLAKLIYTLL